MLGEDADLLLSYVESLTWSRSQTGGYTFHGTFSDDCLLPLGRALLRAEAELLTEATAPDVTATVSARAHSLLLLMTLCTPLDGELRERQIAALERHRGDMRREPDAMTPTPAS